MLDYFLKVLLFQTLFLVLYDFILKKETFFQWNRAYLISTSVLSYVIPLVQIQQFSNSIPQESLVWLPEVVLSPQKAIETNFDWSTLIFSTLKWIFFIGLLISFVFFIVKFIRLLITIHKNEKEKKHNYSLVFLKDSSAFSFFNFIFLGSKISEAKREQIIEHELVHVQQKHSIDLLFFELQKIICWFNPYSYFYQKRISELHEFIADAKSVKNKTNYFQNILAEAFGTHKISFINHFFKHSLIKKRIVMLNKAKSKKVLKFKYIFMLPLIAGMLIYSSCEKQDEVIAKDRSLEELVNELKEKSNEKQLSEEELVSLMKIIRDNSSELSDEKRKFMEEYNLKAVKKNLDLINSYKIEADIENVPFAVVEEAPIFPGCEGENSKACFNKSMQNFIRDNFDKNVADNLDLESGRKRIYVQFKIDKNGNVADVKSRAPHPDLQKYAVDLVEKLPQMTPGKFNGKNVNVTYMLPIAFDIK